MLYPPRYSGALVFRNTINLMDQKFNPQCMNSTRAWLGQKSEVTKLRPLKLEPGVDLLLPPVDRVLLVMLHVLLLPVGHLHWGQEPDKSSQCKMYFFGGKSLDLPQCLDGAVQVLHTRRKAAHQQDLDRGQYKFCILYSSTTLVCRILSTESASLSSIVRGDWW